MFERVVNGVNGTGVTAPQWFPGRGFIPKGVRYSAVGTWVNQKSGERSGLLRWNCNPPRLIGPSAALLRTACRVGLDPQHHFLQLLPSFVV